MGGSECIALNLYDNSEWEEAKGTFVLDDSELNAGRSWKAQQLPPRWARGGRHTTHLQHVSGGNYERTGTDS